MITEDGEWVVCDAPPCTARVKNHRWGRTKAEGWFFEKAREDRPERAWCPEHNPPWVAEWRAKRG